MQAFASKSAAKIAPAFLSVFLLVLLPVFSLVPASALAMPTHSAKQAPSSPVVPGPWAGSHTKIFCNTAHVAVVYSGYPVWPGVAQVSGYEAWLDRGPFGTADFYEDGRLIGTVDPQSHSEESTSAYSISHTPSPGAHEVTVRIKTAGEAGECTARASLVFVQLPSGLGLQAAARGLFKFKY